MRTPTSQEMKEYQYLVNLTIDVKRTDGALLTDSENVMVKTMQAEAEVTIAKVMADAGHKRSKHLGSRAKVY